MSAVDRVRRGDDESGFALIFVLLVSTVIMIGLATIASPNIPRARQGQDAVAATAAARAGVDDVIAYLVSVPSCRSESRICPVALGQSSAALAQAGKPRPALGNGQTFSWRTGSAATADGYLRVTSTGSAGRVTRRIVADLSLRPSILAYGYYSDYETQPSKFFNEYYKARNIPITDSTVWSNVSSTYRGSASAPQTATWNGAANTTRCDRHWYKEGTVAGRATNGTTWSESGTVNSKSPSRSSSCDLVFSSAMTEDGLTFTRDAMNISTAGGTGPKFNQPVFTMWGYNDGDKRIFNSPAPTAGKIYRGDTMSGSPYLPQIAPADLQLPGSVSTDGIAENSCVYYGPTRMVLNNDGTATVTSPYTTTRGPDSDPRCYPTGTLTTGSVVGFRLNYQTIGSGTVQVLNLGSAPGTGWPANLTKSTQTPGAGNEVLWLPAATAATADAPTSAAPDTCSSATYSAAVSATCAWTNIRTTTDGGSTKGWTAYSSATCSSAAPTNRQLFECEYAQAAGTANPAISQTGGQYATVRTAVKNYLAAGNCTTGTAAAQATCLQSWLNTTVLPQANTSRHAYNYATPANGDRQYYAVVSAGTASNGSAKAVGAVPANPTPNDALFTWTGGTAAQETPTYTPITATIYRQTRASGAWSSGTPQFSVTDTNTTWNITTQATGTSYFPNIQDATAYNTGTNSAGATAGSAGINQPGDLYVEGRNSGKLSVVAQNDVIVTGNISNPANYSPDNHAVSIVAGDDVRNYHPVSCLDQTAADINATTAGFCPNDITGLAAGGLVDGNNSLNASHPARQYVNMLANADRSIDAAVFALNGSLRTDNYDRGVLVGNLTINGGLYQSHRGANGVQYQSDNGTYVARSGTTLIYHYVDLQRAELPYVPPSTSGNYTRPWNVVSISAG